MDIGFSGLARGAMTGVTAFVALAIAASLFSAVWVLFDPSSRGLVVVYVVLVVALVPLLVWLVRLRRRFLAVRVALHLDPQGLVARSAAGSVSAPWDAVTGARLVRGRNGRRLVVTLAPASDPRAMGIRFETTPAAESLIRDFGIGYLLSMLAVDADTLRSAFADHSGGRIALVG